MLNEHGELQRKAHEHLVMHFAANGSFGPGRREIPILNRGEGVRVYDTRGRAYLDGLSSLFCAQLGYSYGAEFSAAIAEQLDRLAYNTNYSTAHPPAVELAAELAAVSPEGFEKSFFVSGGSEAVESAWKIVRQFHIANGEPERVKAIARRHAYHGVTLGALSFTGIPGLKEPFGTAPVPVRHISTTNVYRTPHVLDEAFAHVLLAEAEQAILDEGPETVAMIIAEPLQNVGGCLAPPPGYWPGLRRLADRYGILLLADEVISGFGRAGDWFAGNRYGAEPDVITVAKGLSSAYAPIGAVLLSERVAEPFYQAGQPLLHGLTFGGHPVSTAVALKNLEIFHRDRVLENVRMLERHLAGRMRRLLDLPIVGDVRGDGFFWAAELIDPSREDGRFTASDRGRLVARLTDAMLAAGLIVRVDARADLPVVQIAPPLVSTADDLDELVDRMGTVIGAVGGELRGAESCTS